MYTCKCDDVILYVHNVPQLPPAPVGELLSLQPEQESSEGKKGGFSGVCVCVCVCVCYADVVLGQFRQSFLQLFHVRYLCGPISINHQYSFTTTAQRTLKRSRNTTLICRITCVRSQLQLKPVNNTLTTFRCVRIEGVIYSLQWSWDQMCPYLERPHFRSTQHPLK